MLKNILLVVITALVVGSGVYVWQHKVGETHKNETPKIDWLAEVEKRDDSVLYFVSSESLRTTNVVFKDSALRFSLSYPYFDWGVPSLRSMDMTGNDGEVPLNAFALLTTYTFCSGIDYCNPETKEGKGFEIELWNGDWSGRAKDPNFFTKNGEKLLATIPNAVSKHNPLFNNLIVTYTSFKGGSADQAAVDTLLKTFKLLK